MPAAELHCFDRPSPRVRRRLPGLVLALAPAAALLVGAAVATAQPAPEAGPKDDSWRLFRGDSQATGVARSSLPSQPQLLWRHRVPKGAFESTPVIADGTVYIGDLDGNFFALALDTGKVKWQRKLDTGFIAAAAVRDGRVFVGDIDGVFHCFQAKDGADVWTLETEAEIDAGANFFKDRVLFGSQDATLYCAEAATGKLAWKHLIDDQIRCSPTLADKTCFVAGCDSKLHAINVETGEKSSDVDIMSPTGSTPAIAGHFAYFGTEGGEVLCVDWKANKVAWRFEVRRGAAFRGSPAVTDDLVIIGGRDKRLHAIGLHDGEQKWSYLAKNRIDSSPVIVGDRAFFGSTDGVVHAVQLKDGKEVWSYEAGGGFIGSPAVAGKRLVIANDNGTIYCFGEKSQ